MLFRREGCPYGEADAEEKEDNVQRHLQGKGRKYDEVHSWLIEVRCPLMKRLGQIRRWKVPGYFPTEEDRDQNAGARGDQDPRDKCIPWLH
jgi:hypothetical protein